MARYLVTNPTQDNNYQVIDTRNEFVEVNIAEEGRPPQMEKRPANALTCAIFTRYCPNSKTEAEKLAAKLNQLQPPWNPPEFQPRFQLEDIKVTDIRHPLQQGGLTIAFFSTRFLPPGVAETAAKEITARLNASVR